MNGDHVLKYSIKNSIKIIYKHNSKNCILYVIMYVLFKSVIFLKYRNKYFVNNNFNFGEIKKNNNL